MVVDLAGGIFAMICFLIAAPALLLAILLGAASWYSALRMDLDGSSKVFARGFLGVSAVGCAAVGIFFGVAGVALWIDAKADIFTPGILIGVAVSLVFLSAEFVIAGSLYRKVRHKTRKRWPAVLSWGSYALGGVLSLSAILLVSFVAMGVGLDMSNKPRESSEVRHYRSGCNAKHGSDCNMLGLHYRDGSGGVPKNEGEAAILFQRSCDLDFAQGCRNAAHASRYGEGVPRNPAHAERLEKRAKTLEGRK